MLVYRGPFNEDMLTACTFGLFKYLPSELFFKFFVEFLSELNPKSNIDINVNLKDIKFWPLFEVPLEWRTYLGRVYENEPGKMKATIEPDVVLETDEWLMFVEAEKSHIIEAEQLFQQYAVGYKEAKTRNLKFYLLLINSALSRPRRCEMQNGNLYKTNTEIHRDDSPEFYIIERGKGLNLEWATSKNANRTLEESFLWCNWASFYITAEKVTKKNSDNFIPLRKLLDDLKELLERIDETPISWLEDDFSIKYKSYPLLIPSLSILPNLSDCGKIDPFLIPTIREIPDVSFLLEIFIDFQFIPKIHEIPEVYNLINLQIQSEVIPAFTKKEGKNGRKIGD